MVFGVLLILFVLLLVAVQPVLGSAPPGLPATMATTSSLVIGPPGATQLTSFLLATSSTCATRIVSTPENEIYLGFTGAFGTTSLSIGRSGIFQATGTTVVYDSGQYGCGTLTAISSATTTINISETR